MVTTMRHVAIKIALADLEEKKDFYMDTVGMKFCRQSKTRDHTSCHLTDGYIDFTLVAYDEDEAIPVFMDIHPRESGLTDLNKWRIKVSA